MSPKIDVEDKYKEKMAKLGPMPDDMRIFYVGSDTARIEARTTYTLQCIDEGVGIYSALDDMAQIIGWRAKLVNDDEKEIIAALLENGACLVKPTAGAKGGAGAEGFDRARELSEEHAKEEHSIWDRGYAVTLGRDPYEAYVALTVLEKAAEVQIKSKALGGVKPLEKGNAKGQRIKYLSEYSTAGIRRRNNAWDLLEKIKQTITDDEDKPSKEPAGDSTIDIYSTEKDSDAEWKPVLVFGESYEDAQQSMIEEDRAAALAEQKAATLVEEFEGRKSLVAYSNRLLEKNLVQGTWGNLSVRIDAGTMLTTPSGIDYDLCGPEDMVLLDIKDCSVKDNNENAPTSEKFLHAAIYKARPDVGAIIHTHSTYCSIFAACQMPLEVSEPEFAKDLGDIIYIADYAKSGSDKLSENAVKAIGAGVGCILSNHGMVVCGKDLDEAFEGALLMEDVARREINKRL